LKRRLLHHLRLRLQMMVSKLNCEITDFTPIYHSFATCSAPPFKCNKLERQQKDHTHTCDSLKLQALRRLQRETGFLATTDDYRKSSFLFFFLATTACIESSSL